VRIKNRKEELSRKWKALLSREMQKINATMMMDIIPLRKIIRSMINSFYFPNSGTDVHSLGHCESGMMLTFAPERNLIFSQSLVRQERGHNQ